MIQKYRDLSRDDSGIAMIWLATMLVLLLGMAALAVDLGWLYLSASRAQRTVDSSATAGVVHLPGFPTDADLAARDASRANGYDVCNPPATSCADTLTSTPLLDNRLHVELQTEVPTFFLKALGFDSIGITRDATAEYVRPVPLGSPNQCFGQDPTGTFCPADITDFWGAVNGPYTRKHDGDPYSTHCVANSSASSCSGSNSDYQRGGTYEGYYYAVEVFDTSQPLEIWVYDARMDERPSYPNVETGDWRYSGGGNNGVTTRFEALAVDATPQDPTDNGPASCSSGPQSVSYSPDLNPSSSAQKNTWTLLCTIASPALGLYEVHVESTGSNGSGTNNYSIAARQSGAPTQPRVYGINDMSIFSNNLSGGSWSQLYLVEVSADNAGSKLELQFFDAGDADGHSEMRVKDPLGNIPNCDWEVWNHNQTNLLSTGSGACSWITAEPWNTQIYNNRWIKAVIDLPDDPALMCGSDCFWFMELDLDNPNERTTWRARVIGNPVRLVP